MHFHITHLNNKSRKGLYAYVKHKGKRGQYYKLNDGDTIDPILQYYRDRYIKKKPKGSIRAYKKTYSQRSAGTKMKRTSISRQADHYLRKSRKKPTLAKAFKKGITNSVLNDSLSASYNAINVALKQLFRPLVLDNDLLDALAQPETVNKLRNRLEHRITLKGTRGEVLATSGIFKKGTYEAVQELQKKLSKGEQVTQESPNAVREKLKALGYTGYGYQQNGSVQTVHMNIIFRKG